MPKRLTAMLAVLALVASSVGLAACGDEGPEPSIPQDSAEALLADLQEIQANIDVDSCIAASSRVDSLIEDIQGLPPDVNQELKRNLEASAERLQTLLFENNDSDPACTDDREQTTTEETTTDETTTEKPTTTEETTTEETTTTQPTTTTTPTTPTNPGGGSGGIGPGGSP
jgi:hypothetical protein